MLDNTPHPQRTHLYLRSHIPDQKFLLRRTPSILTENFTQVSDFSSQDLISQTSPDLTVQPIRPLTITNLQRMSEYDNLSGLFGHNVRSLAESSVGTFYCKPWDSSAVSLLIGLIVNIPFAERLVQFSVFFHSILCANFKAAVFTTLHSVSAEGVQNQGVLI